jgi:glyoxylase-like metal-dependent hydrolase (beta-lactamase superfamily II)
VESPFENTVIPMTSVASGNGYEAANDLYVYTVQIVNICFVGGVNGWVLVDAGMPRSAKQIIDAAEERFGRNVGPQAIVLTHGHFDHVGAILHLIDYWNVPVYAHNLELPYLRGAADYPPGDPTVDGGLVSELSPFFPHRGIDLGERISALQPDGALPFMPGWRWIHTPGHTPGHISLFRDSDRALIAGDAFVTVKQESVYKVITQQLEISGPPKYFTTDWESARESVNRLYELRPAVAVTGHGKTMSGELLSNELGKLVRNFQETAVPEHGRFTHEPNKS